MLRDKKSTRTVAILLSWIHQLAKSNACNRDKANCAFGRICDDQLNWKKKEKKDKNRPQIKNERKKEAIKQQKKDTKLEGKN